MRCSVKKVIQKMNSSKNDETFEKNKDEKKEERHRVLNDVEWFSQKHETRTNFMFKIEEKKEENVTIYKKRIEDGRGFKTQTMLREKKSG